MPELYEERRRTRAVSSRTHAIRSANGAICPDLDAALLETYFGAFRAAGDLPDPPVPDAAAADAPGARATSRVRGPSTPLGTGAIDVFDPCFLSSVVGATVRRVDILSAGSDHSIVSELTAWRSKRPTGLFRARLVLDDEPRDVFIKVKALDTDVMAVGEALAGLVDPAVGRAYRRHIGRIGFAASAAREVAVYRQADPRITAHLPGVLGTAADESTGTWIAVLEDVRGAALVDSVDRPEDWGQAEIGAAIDGLASLHAVWLGRDDELQRKPWIGHVPTASGVRGDDRPVDRARRSCGATLLRVGGSGHRAESITGSSPAPVTGGSPSRWDRAR